MDGSLDRRLMLARRLRTLRQERWSGRSLTQGDLAQALGGDYGRLSVPLISSWESVADPKVPPLRRLEAYATFFATSRSIVGRPHLLALDELTDDELRARQELLHELTQLRTNALQAPQIGGAEQRVGHVFISYVREDSRRVDQLQGVLQGAGIPVWRDTADLWPGEDWRIKIRGAITDEALVFVVCFSHASIARRQSYQNEELYLAIEQLRRRRPDDPWLIPVRFDECEIPDWDIGGGRTLASIQRADLFGERFEEDVKRLLSVVRRILE